MSLNTVSKQTLRASVMTEEKRSDVFEVKVVNCDTITQVKEKIIEVYYRDKPYSECPKPDKLQLGKWNFSIVVELDEGTVRLLRQHIFSPRRCAP